MSGFPILDLVVGIIFVYFLLSIVCSSAVEMVLTIGKYRAKMLERWLRSVFDKEIVLSSGQCVKLGQAIMDHCTTKGLSEKGSATSYIDAKNFSTALLEKITYDPANPKSIAKDIDELITAIQNTKLLSADLQGALLGYAYETKDSYRSVTEKYMGEIQLFKSKIENWYDSSMDRVSGALKQTYTRRFTFWLAFIIVLGLNADSISIAKYLYTNPEARTRLVAKAYSITNNDTIKNQVTRMVNHSAGADTVLNNASMQQITDTLTARAHEMESTKAMIEDVIPLSWNGTEFKNASGKFYWPFVLSKIAGLLVTILAVMMGAPFWFDVLNKISNLRGSGAKPASQKDKGQ